MNQKQSWVKQKKESTRLKILSLFWIQGRLIITMIQEKE